MTHAAHETMDRGGLVSLVIGSTTWAIDKLNIYSINDILTGVSLAVGIVWVVFKIRNERLMHKINKKKLENEG